jgi:hypothetical protein
MVSDRFHRRTIALVAAYAVALQAIFLTFVPVAPANPTGLLDVFCSRDGANGTGHSPEHDLPCAAMCAALGHGVTGPLPFGASLLVEIPQLFETVVPISQWTFTDVARTEPHAPRGPPLA